MWNSISPYIRKKIEILRKRRIIYLIRRVGGEVADFEFLKESSGRFSGKIDERECLLFFTSLLCFYL